MPTQVTEGANNAKVAEGAKKAFSFGPCTCSRLASCLKGRGFEPPPPPKPEVHWVKKGGRYVKITQHYDMDDFIEALKLEIFTQYNDARTDPVAYSKTAGLPLRAIALLQKVEPVPPFEAISLELSDQAMNKARAPTSTATSQPGITSTVKCKS